jgi:two-component system, cell cycle response regulator
MPNQETSYPRPPLILIVTGQEWVSLSVETLFAPRGYAVLRAYKAAHVLQRVEEMPIDLLVVDRDLRGMTGTELCLQLRDQALLPRATPILMIAPSPWPREEKLEALQAGAWDVCALPMDSEELFLRVDTWVRAKLASDTAREQGLLDPDTGLYNAQGLLRRMGEIGACALRHRRSLACVVVSPVGETRAALSEGGVPASWTAETVKSVASILRAAGRASDSIGRLNPTEFVIVAPETDSEGALGLAERLRIAIESLPSDTDAPLQPRFGCYAVTDFRDESIAPTEMLIRAAEALRNAETQGQPIRFFSRPTEAN